MNDRPDSALLRAWQAGEAGTFEVLVDRHQAALLRHARAFLGAGRSAEDVVQETFLRLAEKPPRLPEEESVEGAPLASWLHRVTRNLCMDTTRTEARRRRREEKVASSEATVGGIG